MVCDNIPHPLYMPSFHHSLEENLKGKKVLYITLKRYWFNKIASGEKEEEYREIKPYWIQKLCREPLNKSAPKEIINIQRHMDLLDNNFTREFNKNGALLRQDYDIVIAKNGYGTNVPELYFIPGQIRVGFPNLEWIGREYEAATPLFIIPVKELLSVKY